MSNGNDDSERFERVHNRWKADNRKENAHEYLLRTLQGEKLAIYKAKFEVVFTEVQIIDYFNQSDRAIQLFEPVYPLVDIVPITEQVGSPEYIKKYGNRNIEKDLQRQIITKHQPSEPYTGNECFIQLANADIDWLQFQIRAREAINKVEDLDMRNKYLQPHQILEAEDVEIRALFLFKLEQSKMIGFKTAERFASHEAQTCETIWHSVSQRFLIADQWIGFLKKVAEGKTIIELRTPKSTRDIAPETKQITFDSDATIEIVFTGLKVFFPKQEAQLKNLLSGKAIDSHLYFPHNQNRLVEVFCRAKYNGKLLESKQEIMDWIYENFSYHNKKSNKPSHFSKETMRSLFNPEAKGEPPKNNRICIHDELPYRSIGNRK